MSNESSTPAWAQEVVDLMLSAGAIKTLVESVGDSAVVTCWMPYGRRLSFGDYEEWPSGSRTLGYCQAGSRFQRWHWRRKGALTLRRALALCLRSASLSARDLERRQVLSAMYFAVEGDAP